MKPGGVLLHHDDCGGGSGSFTTTGGFRHGRSRNVSLRVTTTLSCVRTSPIHLSGFI
jgi:hypothetical protein